MIQCTIASLMHMLISCLAASSRAIMHAWFLPSQGGTTKLFETEKTGVRDDRGSVIGFEI